ncbi:hypothetical protein Tco_0071668 [Tanacetum coccineum]
MSRSTISSESLVKSIGSSALPTIVPHPTSVVDSESEPFKDHASLIDFDSDSFENPPNYEPFEDRVSPVASAPSDSDDEPHDSPATSDYFGGSEVVSDPKEFSEEDPSEDDPTNASFAIEAAIARRIVAPSSPSPPPSPSSPLPSPSPSLTHSGPPRKRSCPSPSSSTGPSRKRCRSPLLAAPTLAKLELAPAASPSIPIELLPPHKRSCPSPSSSAGPSQKRCRSPLLADPTPAELELAPASSPSIPIELLPPRKRFGAMERIETLKKERDRVVES